MPAVTNLTHLCQRDLGEIICFYPNFYVFVREGEKLSTPFIAIGISSVLCLVVEFVYVYVGSLIFFS